MQTDDILVEAVEGYINHTLHPMVCTTPQTLRVFNAAAISCEELENPTSHRTDAVVLEIADSKSTNTQSLDETDDCVSQASNTLYSQGSMKHEYETEIVDERPRGYNTKL